MGNVIKGTKESKPLTIVKNPMFQAVFAFKPIKIYK